MAAKKGHSLDEIRKIKQRAAEDQAVLSAYYQANAAKAFDLVADHLRDFVPYWSEAQVGQLLAMMDGRAPAPLSTTIQPPDVGAAPAEAPVESKAKRGRKPAKQAAQTKVERTQTGRYMVNGVVVGAVRRMFPGPMLAFAKSPTGKSHFKELLAIRPGFDLAKRGGIPTRGYPLNSDWVKEKGVTYEPDEALTGNDLNKWLAENRYKPAPFEPNLQWKGAVPKAAK